MATELEICEEKDRLLFHVRQPRHLKRILFTLLAGAVATWIFARAYSTSQQLQWLVGLLIAVLLIKDSVSALKGTDVRLSITNLDCVSMGHAPSAYRPSVIPRADITNLEYREASGGGDLPDLAEGLYVEYGGALTTYGVTCMLPDIDEVQTQQVVARIMLRFPDTGTLPSDESGHHFITLNLSQPERT